MAYFVQLTTSEGKNVWVNLDLIVEARPMQDGNTRLTTVVRGDANNPYRINVQEQAETVASLANGSIKPESFDRDT